MWIFAIIWKQFKWILGFFCFYHGTSAGAASPKAALVIARTRDFSSFLRLQLVTMSLLAFY
jgi:hypothetical protein